MAVSRNDGDYEPGVVARTLMMLRADALEKRMDDLSLVYGWSAIRLNGEAIDAQMRGSK